MVRWAPRPLLPGAYLAAALWAGLAFALLSPPAAAAGAGAGLLLLTAAAVTDLLRAPRPAELAYARQLPGPLRLGRPVTVTMLLRWDPPSGRAGRRQLWWAELPPPEIGPVARGPCWIEPGRPWRISYRVCPGVRADCLRWSGPRLALSSPWGLWWRVVDTPAAEHCTVYPAGSLTRGWPGRPEDTGVPAEGSDGVAFDRVRPAQPGEVPRRIAWRLSARSEAWWVVEGRPERGERLLLVLDAGRWAAVGVAAGPPPQSRLDVFTAAALQLAQAALRAGDAPGLMVLDERGMRLHAPRSGPEVLRRLSRVLAGLGAGAGDPDYGTAAQVLGRAPADMLLWCTEAPSPIEAEGLATALGLLAQQRPTACLLVRPEALDPPSQALSGSGEAATACARAELVRARGLALARLRRAGVLAADAPPSRAGEVALGLYRALSGAVGGRPEGVAPGTGREMTERRR